MHEINVMSLMAQLNRGNTAKLSNHDDEKLSEIAEMVNSLYEEFYQWTFRNGERTTDEMKQLIIDTPTDILNDIYDILDDLDNRALAGEIIIDHFATPKTDETYFHETALECRDFIKSLI